MLKKGWSRIYKNLVRSIIAGVIYTVALREWVPENWPHFFNSIVSAIIIALNAIDPVFSSKSVLKRQGVVALISCLALAMFHEIVNAIPEQLWWQNAMLVALLGSIFIIRFESLIPYDRNLNNDVLKLKDFFIAILNSLGMYRAIKCFLIDDFLAILFTLTIIIASMTKFSKDNKELFDNQVRIVVIVTLTTAMFITCISSEVNIYILLIIGLAIVNPLLTYMLTRISTDESEKKSNEQSEKKNGN